MLDHIRQSDVFTYLKQQSEPLLLAVSGGPDSTAMLHLFAELVERGDISHDLYAGHVQHDLRDEGPEADRAFVRRISGELDVPFLCRTVSVQSRLSSEAVSPEEAARGKRYHALREMCRETGSQTLLTAHHRDDQIETILMRLMNGTGIQGLHGIWERRLLRFCTKGIDEEKPERIQLVRPLLSISKQSIFAYLNRQGRSWRNDPSNRNEKFRRNFVRKKLVPIVREHLGESFPDLLLRIQRRASKLDRRLRDWWKKTDVSGEMKDGLFRIRRDQVEALSPMLFPYFLRWLKRNLFEERIEPRYHDFQRLNALLQSGETGREELLSDGIRIRLEHGYVVVRHPDIKQKSNTFSSGVKRLSLPGSISWNRYQFSAAPIRNVRQILEEFNADPWREVIDTSKISGSVSITSRRQGDLIRPIGFSGHKQVTDLMIDEKIPASERDRWPILRDRYGIVWIPGLRLSHRVRITGETRRKNVFLFQCRK